MIALALYLVAGAVILFFGALAFGLIACLFEAADERARNLPPEPPRKPLELPEHLLPYSLIARRRKA